MKVLKVIIGMISCGIGTWVVTEIIGNRDIEVSIMEKITGINGKCFQKMKYSLINMKYVFIKQIGIEISQLLSVTNIITVTKVKGMYYYSLNPGTTNMLVSHELPLLYLPLDREDSKTLTESSAIEKTSNVLVTRDMLPNDTMEGVVKDLGVWYNAQG